MSKDISIKLTRVQKDFIGHTFINTKGFEMRVIGADPLNKANYLCTCPVCNKDTELFPDAFSVTKAQVTYMSQTPCGCSLTPKYSEEQWRVLVKRECISRDYSIDFKGWFGEFKFAKTKLLLKNTNNDCEWQPTINKFYNQKCDDPLTALQNRVEKRRTPLSVVEGDIYKILSKEGGNYLGFKGGYFNSNSKFDWVCSKGHHCKTSFGNFKSLGRRCRECNKGGYINDTTGNLYIVRWYSDEVSYLKIGITNSTVKQRLNSQKSKTSLNYSIVRTFVHPDGEAIARCEKYIKDTLQCNVCPRYLLPDGFTETMEDNGYNLNYMINYLSFYLF